MLLKTRQLFTDDIHRRCHRCNTKTDVSPKIKHKNTNKLQYNRYVILPKLISRIDTQTYPNIQNII